MSPTSEQVAAHTVLVLDRMEQEELAIVRRAYAKHVLANADVDDARVGAAFAAVRREHFLGPGPWPMLRWPHRYVPTPSDDPVYLYQDALVVKRPSPGREATSETRRNRTFSRLPGNGGAIPEADLRTGVLHRVSLVSQPTGEDTISVQSLDVCTPHYCDARLRRDLRSHSPRRGR